MDVAKFLEYIVKDNRKLSRISALESKNYTYDENEISDNGSSEQTAIENMYCSVCRMEISNILFLPCRQLVICTKCYPDKLTNIDQCPDCQSRIEQIIEIAPRS